MSQSTPPRLSPLTERTSEPTSQRRAIPFGRPRPTTGPSRVTRTETTWPDRMRDEREEHNAKEFVKNLLRCAHVLRGALSEQLNEFGLSDVRCSVLTYLQNAGSAGCSQRALARELCQSESSISTLVDRMASDGLLKREPAPDDRRRRVLSLTESGRDLLSAVNEVRGRRCRGMLRGFGEAELQRSSILLSTLADHLINRSSSVMLLSEDTFEQRKAA